MPPIELDEGRLLWREWTMHPRNRHRDGYDFSLLVKSSPELANYVVPHPLEGNTIDFADPAAVMALNRALLRLHGIEYWEIPDGYLCPGIPGRVDYIHELADLLAEDRQGIPPQGAGVRVLDLGVGANCVYPLIGSREYGWNFVGSDIDPVALKSAQNIVRRNPLVREKIELRRQNAPEHILTGIVAPRETFAACVCNPPFHASAFAAQAGTLRKVKNLGSGKRNRAILNFGGQSNELWCPGGEPAFVRRLIHESRLHAEKFGWFTTLVSKSSSLPVIESSLKTVQAYEVRKIEMTQGQKRSRMIAWTFLNPVQRRSAR